MDEFSKLNIETDTTISLIKEGLELGVDIWITHPAKLTLNKNVASVKASRIENETLKINVEKEFTINNFDFFFIRQDPPFDMNYLTNIYLLEVHNKFNLKPFFINEPSGIKNFTEKIFPLYFMQLMPDTIITSDTKVLQKMLNKHKSVVVKPLYFKGGEGIIKLLKDQLNYKEKFESMIKKFKTPLVVQKFLEKVNFGDKRVLLIDGKPFGVLNRIPKSGEFKANLHLGGRAAKTSLTGRENNICKHLEPFLKINKLFFVGIDLIDEKLTEINVTSPTGVTQINQLYSVNLSKVFWRKLLKKI